MPGVQISEPASTYESQSENNFTVHEFWIISFQLW